MRSWPLILIVDDSSTDVQVISEMLNADYRIKVARNGPEALAVAGKNPVPDLILLDIIMPGMDGFEVCERLKQSPITQAIPIIFLTAVHDESQEARALDLLAADYITKPYSMPVARARIRNKLLSRALPAKPLQRPPHNGQALPPSTGAMPTTNGTELPTPLSKRETEILMLVAQGMTSAEVSAHLSIAKGTVEVHRENIMRKLGVHNIAGMVKCAIRSGLLVP
jgi:DNA-binding NarL/FixJ family response regulator